MATVGSTLKACDGAQTVLKPNIRGLPRGLVFGSDVDAERQRRSDDLEAPT